MNNLIYLLFASAILLNRGSAFVPRQASYLPDLLAMIVTLVIALRIVFHQKVFLDRKYIYLMALYFCSIFIGYFLNDVPAQSTVAGIRAHLKHLPLFLLPAVCDFSEWQFRKQLKFIIPLLLLQLPVTVFQRIYYWFILGKQSGDLVVGTLGVGQSGTLSIALVCALAVLVAFFMKKMVSRRLFIIMAIGLFLPTAINETKVTLVLLPFAVILPALLCEGGLTSRKMRNVLVASLAGVLLLAIFVPIYNQFTRKWDPTVSGLVSDRGYLERYFYTGATGKRSNQNIRRVDLFVISYKRLTNDLLASAFGNGIGSATMTFQDSPDRLARNAVKYLHLIVGSVGAIYFWWETGLIGLLAYVGFLVFLYRDSRFLTRSRDLFGTFALGWSAVITVFGLCLLYQNPVGANILNLLFWYFSGIIAAKTCQLRHLQERCADAAMNSVLLRSSWGAGMSSGRI